MSPLNDPNLSDPQDAIENLVRGSAVSVGEKLTLRAVAAVLTQADIGAAPVRLENGTVGIVSERDVARALADDADPDSVWAADIATVELVTVDARDRILQVAFTMLDADIRHVVVQRDNELLGVVSSRDVFAILAEHAIRMF
jgi:signal-transduction protein with cAMP-binding, CBS, and nucleotidyltransferase domain